MKRSFEFTSFEQAQHFVQRVAKFAQENDHHPEWSLTNGGKTVEVTLTSHFAGNKVTLYDFQLAQRMNRDFKITEKEFRQFPFLSRTTWASVFVFLGSYAVIAYVVSFAIAWAN